jgi:6-phosphogluconolactonase
MNEIKIFRTPKELADDFAARLAKLINDSASSGRPYSIAVSGGNTPRLLFESLADNYSDSIKWEYLRIFWVDERCVNPDNEESNFGTMKKLLLDRINIPPANIHRMKGEENPEIEADRYSRTLGSAIPFRNGLPWFDLILLGMGEDGHTASIFPGNLKLFTTDNLCAVATNPHSGQKRITLTGKVINNASRIVFMVTGSNKAVLAGKILKKSEDYKNYPASYISPAIGKLEWIFDEEAGKFASAE